jgi:anaphase-promoting complex subunit 8
MKNFFFSSFYLEKYQNNTCIEINYGLMCFFKNSTYLINQVAHSFYNSQEFDMSLDWFERIMEIDPYRYENMDTYSNILYIKENQGELANLALRVFYNNKYAPETCCVVGNYYSLMGDHLKAVINFRKALKLDRNCLAAWTLMGHEYLEMKNIAGAIEAYRNAIEIDPKDFRAWYGLG